MQEYQDNFIKIADFINILLTTYYIASTSLI